MSDESLAALQRIADLLDRRVEQHEVMAQKAEARMAQIPTIKVPEPPDWKSLKEEEREADRERQARADAMQAETRAFRERLLAALDRQNELLAQLVARLGTDARSADERDQPRIALSTSAVLTSPK